MNTNSKLSRNNFKTAAYRWRIAKRGKHVMNYCSTIWMLGIVAAGNWAYAAPTGGQVVDGQANVAQEGVNTNISQTTERLGIEWKSFSSEVGEAINFIQPSETATAINRVVGGVPSELRGALNANGRVFIINESGVTFYDTSRVNVGALLATTVRNAGFNGDSIAFEGASEAPVINRGDITISDGGFAILAAPYVENSGYIRANMGRVELASTTNFTVDLRGDNLITYGISKSAAKKLGLANSGKLEAKSGTVALSAKAASDVVSSVINLDGIIDADAIVKTANGGTVLVASVGDIHFNHVKISANGNKGGDVVAKADGKNRFSDEASIIAKGETQGGFIEISGHEVALGKGTLDVTAANGKAGSLLFDPLHWEIRDGAGIGGSLGGISWIYEQALEALSQGGADVELEADSSITLKNLSDDVLTGGSGSISLTANGDDCGGCDKGIFFEDKNDRIDTTSGDIILEASESIIDIGSLKTEGGEISLLTEDSGDIKTRNLTVNGTGAGDARIEVDAAGSIEVDGDIEATQIETTGGDATETAAVVDLDAEEDIAVMGDVIVKAETSAVADDDDMSNTKADAQFQAHGHDIALNGNLTVTADAYGEGENVSGTTAKSLGALGAARNAAISGSVDISANADAQADIEADGTDADATLDVNAGIDDNTGDTTVSGSVNVAANATADGEDVSNTFADVVADLFAARTILLEDWVKAKSYAGAYGEADTSDTGSSTALNVISQNTNTEGDVTAKGDVEATAETDAYGEDATRTESGTTVCLVASGNMTAEGDVHTSAFTDVHATNDATDTTASAALHLRAGKDGTGDLLVKGDTSSKATAFAGDEATQAEGPEAYAYHTLKAAGNASIEGATDSTAIAQVDALEAYRATKAGSWLTVEANGNAGDADSGVLNVDGPVTVLADASHINGEETYYDGAQTDANATLKAKHNATVGDVGVAAYTDSNTDTDALISNAVLDIESGGDASVNTIYSEASTEDKGTSFAHTRVAADGDIILNSDIDPRAEADGAFVQQKFTGDDTDGDDFAELILTPGGEIIDNSSSGGSSSSSSGGDDGGSSSSSSGGDDGSSSSSSGGDDGGSSSSSGGDDGGSSSSSGGDGSSSSGSSGGSASGGGTSGGGSSSGGDGGSSSGSSGGSSSGGDVSGTPDDVTVLSSLTLSGRFNPDALLAAALGQLSPAAGNREFCEVVNVSRKLQPAEYRARICSPKREDDDA